MRFANKTVLITGGNSGIGFATAKAFIDEGARVAITGRDTAKLDAAVHALGLRASGFPLDLADPAAIDGVASAIGAALGHLDVVFVNAGLSGPTPLGNTTREAFDTIIATNLTSVFFTVQAVLPLLVDGGAIVLNSSTMRALGSPGSAAYSSSKAAIGGMAAVFASELAPRGIRVNTVVPGATRTPIWTRGARQGGTIAMAEEKFGPQTPLGRLNEPEEVAAAVLFFADAQGVTAAEIVVDCGMSGAPLGRKG